MKPETQNGNFFHLTYLSARDLNSEMPITKSPEIVKPQSFSSLESKLLSSE
jgi:hypothetical protein